MAQGEKLDVNGMFTKLFGDFFNGGGSLCHGYIIDWGRGLVNRLFYKNFISGALAGCFWGEEAIPVKWRRVVMRGGYVAGLGEGLCSNE